MSGVTIRFYEVDDADVLYEAARESISEVHPWLPWCHPDYALHEAQDWIQATLLERSRGHAYQFAIFDAQRRFLGGCGLNLVNDVHRFANLGYWVRTSATGQGAAVAATKLLAEWAFKNTNLERLEIVAAVDNPRSQRVAEKAGAHREGIARSRLLVHERMHDTVIYSITRSSHQESES